MSEILSLSPLTLTSIILTLAVVFVNGLTDAPNAISTVTVTRGMKLKSALIMSAVFNFLGVAVMSAVNNSVTLTVANIVDFGSNTYSASVALSAALFSIVFWAVLAWYFGIPTSESHALIAGISGSAFALNGGFQAININEITYDKLIEKVKEGAILIDTRTKQEFIEGHLEGAILIPYYEISRRIGSIVPDKDRYIILYCKNGGRSTRAYQTLKKLGYYNIYNLQNGLEGI